MSKVAFILAGGASRGAYQAGCLKRLEEEGIVPDLIVEVRSEDDRWGDILAKVHEYLDAGVVVVIVLDPGLGFSKNPAPSGTEAHNWQLLAGLRELATIGGRDFPVLVGASRKSSLRRIAGDGDLLGASVAAAVAAYERGASILRVHDVRAHVEALAVAKAIA